jgi:BASS family bile acid:Na+ symporter
MIIFRFIANGLAPLTLLGAVTGYFLPEPFLLLKQSFLFYTSLFAFMFACTMFALGLVLEYDDLSQTLKQPRQIALGVLTQYLLMPGLAFLLITLVDMPAPIALGFLIVGCAPGAMASNVIVYLAGGAVAFSIAMTTVATFLSPLLTPALVKWLGGSLLNIDLVGMMITIIKTVVAPLAFGMWLQRYLGKIKEPVKEIAPGFAALAIILICSYAVAANKDRISLVTTEMVSLVILLNALGYISGWYLAKLYGFDHSRRITLSIEIGMQNAGMGVVLALSQFKDTPETALPGALFAVWCILTAAGATAWLRHKAGPDFKKVQNLP